MSIVGTEHLHVRYGIVMLGEKKGSRSSTLFSVLLLLLMLLIELFHLQLRCYDASASTSTGNGVVSFKSAEAIS